MIEDEYLSLLSENEYEIRAKISKLLAKYNIHKNMDILGWESMLTDIIYLIRRYDEELVQWKK